MSFNLNFNNFNITEAGDLQDLVISQAAEANPNMSSEDNALPEI